MEFMEVIESRRSIRRYKKQKVEKEKIERIIEAAMKAPSWKNSQTTRYHIVMSEETLAKIKQCLPEFNQTNCADAPVLVVTSFVKERSGYNKDGTPTNELGNGWGIYDCGLSNQNFLLKAKEEGLDTLVMGIRDTKAIKNVLGIDEKEIIVSTIALGYRDIDPEMPKRKEVTDITKFY